MVRLAIAGVAAALMLVAPQALTVALAQPSQPCVNGVIPLNPYVVNCNLPRRTGHIPGAAPDAGAIIACRHNPWCLSQYVNGPW